MSYDWEKYHWTPWEGRAAEYDTIARCIVSGEL